MICYKDRTFCHPSTACRCAKAKACPLALSKEQLAEASRLDLTVAYYVGDMECFEPQEEQNDGD